MMIPPARAFRTLRDRNRVYEEIQAAFEAAGSPEQLTQAREDYADDLDRMKRDQAAFDTEGAFDMYQALKETFSARAHHLTQEMEFHQCLSNRLPRRSGS